MGFELYPHFHKYRMHTPSDTPNVGRWYTAILVENRVTQQACHGVQLGFDNMACFIFVSLFMESLQLHFM